MQNELEQMRHYQFPGYMLKRLRDIGNNLTNTVSAQNEIQTYLTNPSQSS